MPDATDAQAEMTFLFGSVDARARDAVVFVQALHDLSRGALASCDLGASTRSDHFVAVGRFRAALPASVARRLDFWAWRAGGTASAGGRQGHAALLACDRIQRGVEPALVAGALRELLTLHLGAAGDGLPERPTLRLSLDQPELAGMAFDPSARTLLVPSPRLPPIGERMALEIRLADGAAFQGEGVVLRLSAGGEQGPGAPSGFVLSLVAPATPFLRALEESAPKVPGPERRRGPRYALDAPAVLAPEEVGAKAAARGPGPAGDAWVESLSQGGAFVSTEAPAAVGTRVKLDLAIPGGPSARVGGTVIYGNERGLGIRFELNREGEAAIGTAIEHVATHPRRALVVDHDTRVRRGLGAALLARGFEVFSAADGSDGLRVLIDLLLGLDLLLVDLHAPGLDGERLLRLVRDPGGERDLTIVVMGGELDEAAEARLLAAGADSVARKGGGIPGVAEEAVRALRRRERAAWSAEAMPRATA
jgi:CheY-like chemotaxis protein